MKRSDTSDQIPELNPDVRDPVEVVFGFGRRVCPGRYMAYEFIWITIVSVLASFNIEKAKDEHGRLIIPSGTYIEGFIRSVPDYWKSPAF